MRIISGSARGRRLKGPPSHSTRPMTDKIRGAVFNSLASLGVDPDRVADFRWHRSDRYEAPAAVQKAIRWIWSGAGGRYSPEPEHRRICGQGQGPPDERECLIERAHNRRPGRARSSICRPGDPPTMERWNRQSWYNQAQLLYWDIHRVSPRQIPLVGSRHCGIDVMAIPASPSTNVE